MGPGDREKVPSQNAIGSLFNPQNYKKQARNAY